MRQGWITADPSRMLKRRKPRPDRARGHALGGHPERPGYTDSPFPGADHPDPEP